MKRLTSILLVAFGLLCTATAEDHVFVAKVVGIHDGDTITVLAEGNKQIKIRLTGIDAPELKQDFGTVSRKTLSDLVFGKQVSITDHGQDRYMRTLADVRVGRQWINFEMVNRGMAWMYRAYTKDPVLNAAENGARQLKSGLWSQPDPVAPWLFRKKPKPVPDSGK